MFRWRMEVPCESCPFNSRGPGLQLRKSLRSGRWKSILASLLRGEHFKCHKTTTETGDGTNLICAGSIRWEKRHKVCSNLRQVMERLEKKEMMMAKTVQLLAYNFDCLPGHVQISGRGSGSNLRVAAERAIAALFSDERLKHKQINDCKLSLVVISDRKIGDDKS